MNHFSVEVETDIKRAAQAIGEADALLIAAGAGMGVDSGLPDFRGDEGFWNAYPPLRELGISFAQMANPQWFERDPALAWGFYGHRLNLYRATAPHDGFALLRDWTHRKSLPSFVFTSNVDGHFQRAGFDEAQILERHGSLGHLQCTQPCGRDIWPAVDVHIELDAATFRAHPPLPACPHCKGVARPNVLMFGDGYWIEDRTQAQMIRYQEWLMSMHGRRITVIECGAGRAIPTVRHNSEALVRALGAQLIRINPREADSPTDAVALEMGARQAIHAINEALAAA